MVTPRLTTLRGSGTVPSTGHDPCNVSHRDNRATILVLAWCCASTNRSFFPFPLLLPLPFSLSQQPTAGCFMSTGLGAMLHIGGTIATKLVSWMPAGPLSERICGARCPAPWCTHAVILRAEMFCQFFASAQPGRVCQRHPSACPG